MESEHNYFICRLPSGRYFGSVIQSGQKKVRIHGEEIDINARIRSIETYSAHADEDELIHWVKSRLPVKRGIFVTHGSDQSRSGMVDNLKHAGIDRSLLIAPAIDEIFSIDGKVAEKIADGKPRIKNIETVAQADWHNRYARFVLDLAQELRTMEAEDTRHDLLDKLNKLLR